MKLNLKNYRSIRVKISVVVAVTFSITAFILNLIIYKESSNAIIQSDNKILVAEGEALLSKINGNSNVIPLPKENYSIQIWEGTPDGIDVKFVSPDFPFSDTFFFEDQIITVDSFKVAILTSELITRGESTLFLAISSENKVFDQLKRLRATLVKVSMLAVLASTLIALFLTNLFLKPIRKIIDTTSFIQASKNMGRLGVPDTKDELQKLAETINTMLTRIESDINNQVNFFSSAAHELRTPLAIMQAELELALNKYDGDYKKLILNQLNEVQRLGRVIQDFLLISQLKTDTLKLFYEDCFLDELLYSALKKVHKISGNEHIKIRVEERPFPSLSADSAKLENVMINLLENAFKYKKGNTKIEVQLTFNKDAFVLKISNDIEKPIENIDLLTSEYYKSKELSTGLGLGLWISHKIIILHGGELNLSQKHNIFTAEITLFQEPTST